MVPCGGSILREVAPILYNMGGTFLEGDNTCFGALEGGNTFFVIEEWEGNHKSEQ